MSLLAEVPHSRICDFLSIGHTAPIKLGPNEDIFVGDQQRVKLTLPQGSTTECRDLVVLGQLFIAISPSKNAADETVLITRDVFNAGLIEVKGGAIGFKSRNFSNLSNLQTFRKDLTDRFLEGLQHQRDSVNAVGLRSILV